MITCSSFCKYCYEPIWWLKKKSGFIPVTEGYKGSLKIHRCSERMEYFQSLNKEAAKSYGRQRRKEIRELEKLKDAEGIE